MALTHGKPLTDAQWQCLQDRAASTGIYGVTSTGIFCRPGCRARTPLRKNALAFPSPDAAQAAGFRACKRCGGGLKDLR